MNYYLREREREKITSLKKMKKRISTTTTKKKDEKD